MNHENSKQNVVLFLGSGASVRYIDTGQCMRRCLKLIVARGYNIKNGIRSVLGRNYNIQSENFNRKLISLQNLLITLCYNPKNHTLEDILSDISKINTNLKSIIEIDIQLQNKNTIINNYKKYKTNLSIHSFRKMLKDRNKKSNKIFTLLDLPLALYEITESEINQYLKKQWESEINPVDLNCINYYDQNQLLAALIITVEEATKFVRTFIYKQCTIPNQHYWDEYNPTRHDFNLDRIFNCFNLNTVNLTIATTNYDLIPEIYMRGHNICYNDGFDKNNNFTSNYCSYNNSIKFLKIHGSVDRYIQNGYVKKNNKIVEIVHSHFNDESSTKHNTRNNKINVMGKKLNSYNVLTSNTLLRYHGSNTNKEHKATIAELERDIEKSAAVIVIGYGFNDNLNKKLIKCFNIAANQNKLIVGNLDRHISISINKRKINISKKHIFNYNCLDYIDKSGLIKYLEHEFNNNGY